MAGRFGLMMSSRLVRCLVITCLVAASPLAVADLGGDARVIDIQVVHDEGLRGSCGKSGGMGGTQSGLDCIGFVRNCIAQSS